MTSRLAGKRALVVGASRGIGRAISEAFVREGASVALAARSREELDELSNALEGETMVVRCDLASSSDIEDAIHDTLSGFGGIDVIVNSVGILTRGKLSETAEADLERVVDINLLGALRLARAGLPELVKSAGTLINISSEAAERGVPQLPAYCATKGAINALTQQLAIDYAGANVRVNAIAPGTTMTSMNEQVRRTDPEWESERSMGIPLGRLASTDDMTGAALFLASDEASYVTGEILNVDGGSTAT